MLIPVVASPRLLPEAAALAEHVRDVDIARNRVARGGEALTHPPCDVESGHITDCKGSHREAKCFEGGVNLLRRSAFFQHELALAAVGSVDAVANKHEGIGRQYRDFPEPLRNLQARHECIRRCGGAAHDLEQAHDVCRTKEMESSHILRTRGTS